MSVRKRILMGGTALAILGAVAVVAAFIWYTWVMNDTPPQVSLQRAVATLTGTPVSGVSGQTSGGAATQAADGGRADDLAGTWTIVQNGSSFVGYRVAEELARIGSTTAVGRTNNVRGTLTFDGKAITDVQVTADLSTLQSDQAMRDNALRRQALETATYPTATFRLTQPIVLDSIPPEGVPVTVTAVGELTLHGVTRPITITLQGQRTNGLVVVVGSTEIRFADFNIQQPRSFNVLSVADHGTLELQLVFQHSGQG